MKHVQRAQIILLSAERLPVLEIAKRVGISRPMVWRWQQRFAEEGIEGLLRDKTRPPGIPPVPQAKVHAVVERTLREPPGAVTHWTGRAMAKAMGLSLRTIQRIWAAHKLQPHRIRTFKRSNDPDFAAKLDDVVGLYMNPPRHAAVVSIDEKSQIQALDRTQPGLPLKRGKCATLPHDYKRHGTTTLFAALSVLEGKVIGRCAPRHRHQEFIRFIATVERSVPAGKVIHAILDNYAAHKHPQVLAWLAEHPRWTFHFTPTSCSWLNAVEGFFSKLTRQSLKRGVFRSVDDLESAITRYIAATNRNPKPFVWTATAKIIQAKLTLNHPSEVSALEARSFGEFGEKWLTAAPMADSTRAMRRSIFERELLPRWRTRLLTEITPDDLRAHCGAIVERGAPATAIHVRDILKQIYGFAILHGEKVADPADDVSPSSIATFVPKDRSLSPIEIRIMLKPDLNT